jgi:hypothetical protein
MEILSISLCDSAADYNGKLCILGAFDTIAARELPAVHPFCALAIRFISRPGDEGKHQLKVRLIDSDGRDILPMNAVKIDFTLPPIPEKTFFVSNNCVLNLQGLVLPAVAQYSFDVYVDEAIVARLPMQVIKQEQIRQAS